MRPRGRAVRATALIVPLALLLSTVAATLWYRRTYWSWPWEREAGQVFVCERQFLPSNFPPRSGREAFPDGTRTKVASLPLEKGDVYSALTPAARAERKASGSFCDSTVFVQTSPDTYVEYGGQSGD